MTSKRPSSSSIGLGPVRAFESVAIAARRADACGEPARRSALRSPSRAPPRSACTGKISFEDFGTVVRAVGLNPTEAELEGAGSSEKDLGAVQAFVKQLDETKPSKSDVENKVCCTVPTQRLFNLRSLQRDVWVCLALPFFLFRPWPGALRLLRSVSSADHRCV